MTPLRQRMLKDMHLRGLSARTQETYVRAVRQLADYYGTSPDRLTDEEVRHYFLSLHRERQLSRASCTIAQSAIKFFYEHTLHRPWVLREVVRPAKGQTLPVVHSPQEIGQIQRPQYRVCLSMIAACGLWLLEGVRLPGDADRCSRMQLHIQSDKGNKNRYVPLLPLPCAHWASHRNPVWLFPIPGTHGDPCPTATVPMDACGVQHAFRRALREVGIPKPASVHTLRHSWVTHLLESGVNLRLIQLWLCHSRICKPTIVDTNPPIIERMKC